MRIRDIRIDGFGRFAGQDFGPFERPVTIFHGPNEAGKSTLLEFVRRVLFGFPRRNAKTNAYPAITGGNYGGLVTLEGNDGRIYNVLRTSGRSYSGEVSVTSHLGDPLPESELTTLLGHHSQDVFEQVFAFTLDELYSDDLLSDANVNSQIYSAGMGVTSLRDVMASLDRSRNSIFLSGGSKQEIYSAASRLDDIDSTLREVADNAARYGELTERLQQVESELESLAARRRTLQNLLGRQTRLQSAWDFWNNLVSAEQELSALPAIEDFPTDGLNRLEKLEERVRIARHELETANDEVRAAKLKADVTVPHVAILRSSSDIRRLQNGRTAFDGSVKDLPERETELEGHRRILTETLQDLGPDWDEVRLEEFDLSLAVRQEITQHGDRLREASAELSSRTATLVQDSTALEEAIEAEGRAQRELEAAENPGLDGEEIRQRRSLARNLRSQLDEIGRQRQNVLNLQSQLEGLEAAAPSGQGKGPSATVAALSFFVGIALLIGGAVLGGTALFIGIVAGIALGGVGVYLFVASKSAVVATGESPLAGPIRDSLRRAEADVQARQLSMTQDAAPFGLEEIDESSLLGAEDSIDEEESRLRDWARLKDALDTAGDLAKQRQARAEESATAVQNATERLDAANQRWREWLKDRGLLESFTPETVDVLQRQVELGRSRLEDVRNWQQRIKAIEKDIQEYVDAVEPLATAFDVTFDANDYRTVAAAADRLVELLEDVQENDRNRTDAEAELDDAERQFQDRKNVLEKAEEDLTQLLRSGGAEEAEAFRARAGLYQRRSDLEASARDALDRLQRISGPGEALDRLKADLADSDPQSMHDEISRLEEELDLTQGRRDDLSNERGSIQNELAGLVSEEESSRLRMERNTLVEQISVHARDWARLTLARELLEEARRKFERERQPGVVRHAQEFFADITEGRYKQVYAPLGEQTITVTDADGGTKQPSELSRGTREQLFLSLRFGLIRELGQRTEPLPVIVDEVLVNFDPERALRAAVSFARLSETNQVLVFTCHPSVVDLFRTATSEAGIEAPDEVSIT